MPADPHPLPLPPPRGKSSRGDARAEFQKLTQHAPRDPQGERAFMLGKLHLARTKPGLSPQERRRLVRELLFPVREAYMHTSLSPPFPPRDGVGTDPATSDLREFFAALSLQSPCDRQEDRAFLEHKLELIQSHPTLSDVEKNQLIDKRRHRLGLAK